VKTANASASDLPDICRLLAAERLPFDDLTELSLKTFIVLRDGRHIAGAVGMELYEDVGLLRSLVVAAELRSHGYGGQLASAIEALAEKAGVKSIYLLTTSSEAFFRRRGYRRTERSQAPAAIQGTTQFSALCPASAVLMVKP
jgi:amino-acid N-acetyltransferase